MLMGSISYSGWVGGEVSGARDLNRGLTVPNRRNGVSFRVLWCPRGSSCTQSPSSSCPFVSSCIPWVPRVRDTAATSRGSETDSRSSVVPSFDSNAEGRGGLEPPSSRIPTE